MQNCLNNILAFSTIDSNFEVEKKDNKTLWLRIKETIFIKLMYCHILKILNKNKVKAYILKWSFS